jgi:serine phosphatase RsbU (regulator of sigma subunit)
VGREPKVLAHRIHASDPDAPLRLSRNMLRQILEEGQSFLTAEGWTPTESMVRIGVRAAMGVPLFDNDRIIGAIYVDSLSTGVTFTAEDLSLLTLLGNMVAVKITNSRLEEEERKLEILRRELAVAARIQTNLLPRSIPEVPGYEIFCHLAPCEQVGGDLYDVRRVVDGSVWLSLGDVTGHGIGAAILMSSVMAGLQLLEDQSHDPVNLVGRLEDHLGHHFELGQYVTLFAGILNPATGRLLYVNAGHNPPILLAPGEKRRMLESTGTPVAILPGAQARSLGECFLTPRSTLLVFSDGVCETAAGKVQYDEGPMQAFLDRLGGGDRDAATVGRELLDDVDRFRGNFPMEDDVTLLVLRRR